VSRGLGVEQRGILAVLASKPEQWWPRAHIQQCAWGEQKPGRGMILFEVVTAKEERVLVARRQATGGGKFLAGSVLA
jgi:hypothetical protein